MADGNRHFEHKYFTVRERVALGEIALYWLSGKLNPADVTTKALDKAVTVACTFWSHIGTSTYTNSKRMQGLARSD